MTGHALTTIPHVSLYYIIGLDPFYSLLVWLMFHYFYLYEEGFGVGRRLLPVPVVLMAAFPRTDISKSV